MTLAKKRTPTKKLRLQHKRLPKKVNKAKMLGMMARSRRRKREKRMTKTRKAHTAASTMSKAARHGASREKTGTGITRKIRKLMSKANRITRTRRTC